MSVARYLSLALASATFCFATLASAQSADPEFMKARSARGAAAAAGDDAEYGRYTTDDYVFTDPTGVVKTKVQRMSEVKAAKPATPPAAGQAAALLPEEQFHAYGTAIVRTWRANFAGQPTRFTETWVKQDGVWKVAAGALSPITKP